MVLEEMDVARLNPSILARSTPSALGLVLTLPANSGHPIAGGRGDSRSAFYPVEDVHHARMTDGVDGWGMTFGEDKKKDRLTLTGKSRLIGNCVSGPV